jgi:DNA polymerase III epsilon subunit-like protein
MLFEFTTLINPERIGPTSKHGLASGDVLRTRFGDIAGHIADSLAGCVALAGHNVRFDYSFLASEFERSGHALPAVPTVCTMQLAGGGDLRRSCADYGISCNEEWHSALHDARATAALLSQLLKDDPQSLALVRQYSPVSWPLIPRSTAKLLTRDESKNRRAQPPTYLERLLASAHRESPGDVDDSAALAYSALLDRISRISRLTKRKGKPD